MWVAAPLNPAISPMLYYVCSECNQQPSGLDRLIGVAPKVSVPNVITSRLNKVVHSSYQIRKNIQKCQCTLKLYPDLQHFPGLDRIKNKNWWLSSPPCVSQLHLRWQELSDYLSQRGVWGWGRRQDHMTLSQPIREGGGRGGGLILANLKYIRCAYKSLTFIVIIALSLLTNPLRLEIVNLNMFNSK